MCGVCCGEEEWFVCCLLDVGFGFWYGFLVGVDDVCNLMFSLVVGFDLYLLLDVCLLVVWLLLWF